MSLHVTPAERRAHTRLLRDHKANLPKRIPTASRERIEQAIEAHLAQADALIGVLDRYDGDAGDYEPALGSNGYCHSPERDDQSFWARCMGDEREVDVADEPHDQADEGNDEESLAHTNDIDQTNAQRSLSQAGFNWHNESEHDGREPEAFL